MSNKFLWSNIALGFGWFMFIGGLGALASRIEEPTTEMNLGPFMGLQIIFGVLAYRSAKRAKLGLRKGSSGRTGLEVLALIFVWHTNVLLGITILTGTYSPTLLYELAYNPAPLMTEHLITPVWTLISYIRIRQKDTGTDTIPDRGDSIKGVK